VIVVETQDPSNRHPVAAAKVANPRMIVDSRIVCFMADC
jgi:hypothetical protein